MSEVLTQLLQQLQMRELDRRSREQGTPERFSRLAASDVLTMFGAPVESKGPLSMVPTALMALPAIAEIPLNLGAAGIDAAFGTSLPRFTTFMDKLGENRRQALFNAGTGEPKTTAENVFATATAFLPGPNVGKVATGMNKAQQTLTNLLLPLVQSRSVPGATFEMLAGFLPIEGVNEFVDPEFESVLFEGLFDADSSEAQPPNSAPEPVPEFDLEDMIKDLVDTPLTIETPPSVFNPHGGRPLNEDARGESLEFSTSLGAGLGMSILSMRRGRRGIGALPTMTGKRPGLEQVTPAAVRIAEQIANRHAPLESAVHRAAPGALQTFIAMLKTGAGTPTAIASRVKAALTTGALPNTPINIPSLVIHASTIAKMEPKQVTLYSDALTAMDKLDDLNLSGASLWEGRTRDIARVELNDTVLRASQDPLVTKMIGEVHQMMRGLRDYAFDSGMISREEFTFWRDKRSNYVPTTFDFERQPRGRMSEILNRLIKLTNDQPLSQTTADFMRKRGGEIGPDEGLPPFLLLEERIARAVHTTEQNRIRRMFFEAMDGTQLGNKFIKKVGQPNKFTISVLEDGLTKHYQVGDDAIRASLEFAPRQVLPILNNIRQFSQAMLTREGNPLFVPIAWGYEISVAPVLRSPGANLGIADELLMRSGLPTISRAGDVVGNFFSDPSILVSPLPGAVRTAYADMMFGMWRNMEVSLRVGGTVAQALGQKLTRKLARIGMQAYESSFAHMADEFGAGNAVYASNRLSEDLPTQLNKLAPAYWAAVQGSGVTKRVAVRAWNMYTHVLSQLHNVTRLQHFAANVTPSTREVLALVRERGVRTPAQRAAFEEANRQATAAAAETRRMGIDPGQVGANVLLQKGLSTMRYADISVQAAAEWARTIRKHPVRSAAAISGSLLAFGSAQYMSFRNNPRAADHYYNTLTPSQRASAIYFYKQDSDEVFFKFPIDHLHRPLWSPFTEMLGAVSGIRAGIKPIDAEQALFQEGIFDFFASGDIDEQTAESIRQGLTTAFLQLAPVDVPAIGGVPLALAGKQVNIGRFGVTSDEIVTDVPRSRIDPDQTGATVDSVVSAEVQAAIQELLGTATSPLIDTVNAFNRQYGFSDDFKEAMSVGMKTFLARTVDRARLAPSMLGMRQRVLTSDVASRLYSEKRKGLKNIQQRFVKQLANLGGTKTPPSAPLPSGIQPTDATNTALGLVLSTTHKAESQILREINAKVTRLFEELEDFRRNPTYASAPARLRSIENDIAVQIKNARLAGVERLNDEEAAVTSKLNKLGWEGVFRFDTFDADMAEALAKIPLPPFK